MINTQEMMRLRSSFHGINSDGDSSPDHVSKWYKQNNYDFLVLTDHNHLTILDEDKKTGVVQESKAVNEIYAEEGIDGYNKILEITGGRHPVVEHKMRLSEDSFISNDCKLNNEDLIWLITGPNMAGKSTYLRQKSI